MMNDILKKDWETYTLSVNTDKGVIDLHWSQTDNLAKNATLQSGLFGGVGKVFSKQLFYEQFPTWNQQQWNQRANLGAFDLPDNATIIDIGSGIAVNDLLLSKYLPDSNFVLIDKEEQKFELGIYFSDSYPAYNDWASTKDAIATSGIDPGRFTFSNGEEEWPEADCITSYFSWCFHYPKERYWEKVLNSLKIGGKLVLDIRLLADRDILGEISEELKCEPIMFEYPNIIPEHIDNLKSPDPDIFGHRAVWTREA